MKGHQVIAALIMLARSSIIVPLARRLTMGGVNVSLTPATEATVRPDSHEP